MKKKLIKFFLVYNQHNNNIILKTHGRQCVKCMLPQPGENVQENNMKRVTAYFRLVYMCKTQD